MATKKVFYSWQSDDQATRKFLWNIIQELRNECKTIEITEAMRDISDSPNLKNIDESDVFVCDLSIVGKNNTKFYPDSNVMYELGYAAKSLGNENCIILFNKTKHKIEDLSFDIRQSHVQLFDLSEKPGLKSTDINDLIDMCIPKKVLTDLTAKVENLLKRIRKGPDVIANLYMHDFVSRVEKYIASTATDTDNETDKIVLHEFLTKLKMFNASDVKFNDNDDESTIVAKQRNYNNYRLNMMTNIHKPCKWKMLCDVLGYY